MDRRKFLATAAAGLGAATLPLPLRAQSADAARPNVLLLMADDLNMSLGCYGHPDAITPNLDRFAAGALRFNCAYAQNPKCAPSRTSMLLGLRPQSTGVMQNNDDWTDHVPDAVTMPAMFRRAGYDTVNIGKIFHGSKSETADSWSRNIHPDEGLPPAAPLPQGAGRRYSGPTGRNDIDEVDGRIAEQAVRYLNDTSRDQPFFLAVGLHRPHSPARAPNKYFDLYDEDKLHLLDTPPGDTEDIPEPALLGDPDTRYRTGPLPEHKFREYLKTYLACISFMDACAGRVLDALEANGHAGNTIVVFVSDNGYLKGEHFQSGKEYLFDACAKAPYMMRVPGLTPHGKAVTQPTEYVDTYPTLADLCNLTPPANLEGVSMRPLLADPARPWKRGVFCEVDIPGRQTGRSVRTDRYRYTQWQTKDALLEELYDIQADPHEWTNLANSDTHAAAKNELIQLLKDGWKAVEAELS